MRHGPFSQVLSHILSSLAGADLDILFRGVDLLTDNRGGGTGPVGPVLAGPFFMGKKKIIYAHARVCKTASWKELQPLGI